MSATNSRQPERQQGQFSLGTDAFFKLLVTQLKYQDPSEPMNNQEFMAQTAQFSILEELQSIRLQLASISKMIEQSNQGGANA